MDDCGEKSGSRAETRAQIVATFNRLVLESGSGRPKVAQIVTEAGVARSTFYDHFAGVEALFDESLSMLFGQLATCLISGALVEERNWLMAHIYENRELGRPLLTGPKAERTEALFARLLAERLEGRDNARLHAILISGTVVAALGAWVSGKLSSSPEKLGQQLTATTRAILDA
ncbi:TetR/AcrR family transcriptional regulator [Aurantiacibacter sp. MUD61]|uniref:TetR/AcrR family transcriptional regulator n=1 Tax=Aurantiacibacter sp. MUD61 TaxID=3009083 RepID=UPI0022F00146|nr:TetR/AcrR family transcriptional regulator [Aurantiacibacter sp. MUD61]